MAVFSRRRLELITAITFLSIVGLISVFGWLAYRSLEAYLDAQKRTSIISEQLRALNLTMSTLQDAETGQRGFLLTRDPAYLEPYASAVSTASATFSWLQRSFAAEPGFADELAQLDALAGAKFAELDETIAIATEQGGAQALRIVRSNRGKDTMDRFRQTVAAIQADKRKELAAIQAASSERVGDGKRATIAFGVAIGIFLIGVYWYMIYDLNERRRLHFAGRSPGSRDQLTGLHNAAYLTRVTRSALKYADREKSPLALVMIEIDVPGAPTAPRECAAMAVTAARELAGAVTKPHTLARIGETRFALLLHAFRDLEHVADLAGRVADRLMLALSQSLPQRRVELRIGIAIYPDDSRAVDDLMHQAEYAMRVSSPRRRARYQFANPAHAPTPSREEVLAHGLSDAIANGGFALVYQPQVVLATGEIIGAEALVRWRHPEHGAVPPDEFIPIAERTGLILPLGHWVLAEACRQAMRWQREGRAVRLAVNVCALQLSDPAFFSALSTILQETGLDPAMLEIELTERVMMDRSITDLLTRLRTLWVQVAIDDFGTGYSSLSYLSSFPANVLKVDRSFIRNIPSSARDSSLVRTIVNIGRELGITTVAEGIETPAQAEFLSRQGCDVGQGYLFHKPMPGEVFLALLAQPGTLVQHAGS